MLSSQPPEIFHPLHGQYPKKKCHTREVYKPFSDLSMARLPHDCPPQPRSSWLQYVPWAAQTSAGLSSVTMMPQPNVRRLIPGSNQPFLRWKIGDFMQFSWELDILSWPTLLRRSSKCFCLQGFVSFPVPSAPVSEIPSPFPHRPNPHHPHHHHDHHHHPFTIRKINKSTSVPPYRSAHPVLCSS